MITGKYPSLRLRRNRKYDWTRRLVQENTLSSNDFILPIFLLDGKNKKEAIPSMPDVYRYSIDRISQIVDKAIKNKVPMVALFPKTKKLIKMNLELKLLMKII
jgi:porphobilinogen synthase